MLNYSHTDEGLTLLPIDPKGIRYLRQETRATLVRLGKCAKCLSGISLQTMRCSANSRHDLIFFQTRHADEIDDLVSKESGREKARQKSRWRYDRLSELVGYHTDAQLVLIWEAQQGLCYYCGCTPVPRIGRRPYDKDHMTPISRGGTAWLTNIALTCVKCNHEKSDRTAASFWGHLATRHGGEWLKDRQEACRAVDALKRKLRKQLATRHAKKENKEDAEK